MIVFGTSRLDRASWIRDVLESGGTVKDDAFDRLYPSTIREKSEVYWTPVMVALRAAALLVPEPGLRVLDVGAGCGKLCCIGALASHATWHGIECERELVAAASATAISLGVGHRTSFTAGDITAIEWKAFDCLYFFNPFEAALFDGGLITEPIAQSPRWRRYCREVETTEQCLAEMPSGTRVVTYHGFGGEMRGNYTLAYSDPIGGDGLSLWIKSTNARYAARRASA